jgi:hypothetical protein
LGNAGRYLAVDASAFDHVLGIVFVVPQFACGKWKRSHSDAQAFREILGEQLTAFTTSQPYDVLRASYFPSALLDEALCHSLEDSRFFYPGVEVLFCEKRKAG